MKNLKELKPTELLRLIAQILLNFFGDEDEVISEALTFSGWQIPVGAQNTSQVSGELINYLNFIENELDIPVILIGTGPQRNHLIKWKE